MLYTAHLHVQAASPSAPLSSSLPCHPPPCLPLQHRAFPPDKVAAKACLKVHSCGALFCCAAVHGEVFSTVEL